MKPRWDILYRGTLSSCNYSCGYCPFAKTRNTAEELESDAAQLNRFVAWVSARAGREIGVLFTPWGEALGHRVYQRALEDLSHLPHVYRVSIQTNLSTPLDWVERCDRGTLALWATYHPTQVGRERFLGRCRTLDRLGCAYSVGVVGVREAFDEIRALRQSLDPSVYLWINAMKRDAGYYTDDEVAELEGIDPHFRLNLRPHQSLGRRCRAGSESFTVDGDGTARRCHFVGDPIGNIWDPGFEAGLAPKPCPMQSCRCHIGYVHLEHLELDRLFGDGLLPRIPSDWGEPPQTPAPRRATRDHSRP